MDDLVTYNVYGNVSTRTLSGAVSHEYTYYYMPDSTRALMDLFTPIATETYTYDHLGRMNNISQRLDACEFGKKFLYRKVGDHATNQISSICYVKDRAMDGKLSYTYDAMGNITSVSENGRQTRVYTYDSLNRLIKENLLDTDVEICYTYDNNGNILTKQITTETFWRKAHPKSWRNFWGVFL